MNKKIIIGIDLEPHLKSLAEKLMDQYTNLPLRIHEAGSYHIPLVALGWVPEDAVADIAEDVHDVVEDIASFDIAWTAIEGSYRNDQDRSDALPQHIRIIGGESEELCSLYNALSHELFSHHRDVARFAPHVSLAHVRREQWSELPVRPEISLPFLCTMDVMQITVFEHAEVEGEKTFAPIEVCDLGI